MPYSHHSHSGQFCAHAQGSLEEMVQTAIAKEMRVYCLTEHMPRDMVDLYPEEGDIIKEASDFDAITANFYKEALRLRAKYESQIDILIGFETEWIRDSSLKLIEDLRSKYDWDLFVGSLHHVHTIPIDFDRPFYEKARLAAGGSDEQLFADYFDDQLEMIHALKPPIVGHFDLIRLQSDEPNASLSRFDGVWSKVCRNLEIIASYGGILELNSAALRKGLNEPYPSVDICKIFLEMGGRFTLSDDAHAIEQVGTNYAKLFKAIIAVGIPEIAFFKKESNNSSSAVATFAVPVAELQTHPLFST